MSIERRVRLRGLGPASTAVLFSAALATGMTMLAGAGPTAAAARPAAAPGVGAGLAPRAAAQGTITTVAGGVGGPAAGTAVNLGVSTPIAGTANSPCGVSFAGGQLLVADNWTVRSINPSSGRLTTAAGTAASGPFSDGGPAVSTPMDTCAVAVDPAGNVVLADVANDRIRVVAASSGTFYGQQMTAGDIYTIAGTGSYGFSGDGGPATSAQLSDPAGVAVDTSGNVVLASTFDNRIRVVAASSGSFYGQQMTAGDIYTIAGTGTAGYTGDGGPAASAALDNPQGVTVDGAGNLVIADTGNSAIRVIAASTGPFYGQQMTTGDIYTIAGTGTAGYTGDGGPAASAQVNVPGGVAADGCGNLVIADTGNSAIRVIAASTGPFYGQQMTTGDIYTIAGTGTAGYTGDGGPAAQCRTQRPAGPDGRRVRERRGRRHRQLPGAGDRGRHRHLLRQADDHRRHLHRGRGQSQGPDRRRRAGRRGAAQPALWRRGRHQRERGHRRHRQQPDPGRGRRHRVLLRPAHDRGPHLHRRRHRHRRLRRRRCRRDRGQDQRRRRGRGRRGGQPGARGHRQQPDPGRGRGHRHLLRPADDRRRHLHHRRHRHRRGHRRRRPGGQRPAGRPGQRRGGQRREPGHRRQRQQRHPGDRGGHRHLLRAADDRRRHLHHRRHRHPGLLRRRRARHQRRALLPAGRRGGQRRERRHRRHRQQRHPGGRGGHRHLLRAAR